MNITGLSIWYDDRDKMHRGNCGWCLDIRYGNGDFEGEAMRTIRPHASLRALRREAARYLGKSFPIAARSDNAWTYDAIGGSWNWRSKR